jgi:light-regulated signal transduction histidine kinase (bacteriophytochrome)
LDGKIDELIKQRDEIKNRANVNQEVLNAKENTIKILGKEKNILSITIQKENIKIEKDKIKNYLNWLLVFVSLLVLVIIVLIQKKSIKVKDSKIEEQIMDINKKNTYLEHAARIIRHDMHSGINTYIPRGLTSLEKRVSPEDMKNLNIEGSIKMIREGLNHTQKVYKSVYEFTNLVKQNVVLDKIEINIKDLISKNIVNTSYSSNVYVKDLPTLLVNETLFWTAIDNLIKNGLKYNKSEIKEVNIYVDGDDIVVQDNGIGMDKEKFETIIKQGSGGEESGLGLNICLAILKEHNFNMTCEKLNVGTKIKIKVK